MEVALVLRRDRRSCDAEIGGVLSQSYTLRSRLQYKGPWCYAAPRHEMCA